MVQYYLVLWYTAAKKTACHRLRWDCRVGKLGRIIDFKGRASFWGRDIIESLNSLSWKGTNKYQVQLLGPWRTTKESDRVWVLSKCFLSSSRLIPWPLPWGACEILEHLGAQQSSESWSLKCNTRVMGDECTEFTGNISQERKSSRQESVWWRNAWPSGELVIKQDETLGYDLYSDSVDSKSKVFLCRSGRSSEKWMTIMLWYGSSVQSCTLHF